MQFDKIPDGILSLLILSFPLLKTPIIFKFFPFSKVEPFERRILALGVNIELNISNTPGEALLIPWKTINYLGFSSWDTIALYNSVFLFLTIISPSLDFSMIIFINKSSTLVDFEITIFIISKPNFFEI